MPRRKKTDEEVRPVEEPVAGSASGEPAADAASMEPATERADLESADASEAEERRAGEPLQRRLERMVQFKLGERRFGFPIDDVQEIQQIVALTEFPDASPALVGMVNLRGEVVPVIDLRVLLGMPLQAYTLDTPMIVCRQGAHLVAIIVDEVEDVVELPDDCIQPASKLYELADRLLGVCRMESELVFLLDLARLVPAEDLATFAGVGEGASA